MQNLASLILDLAYSSVIFPNEASRLQTEVLRIESSIDKMVMQLEIQAMLATRDLDDAKANISLLRIGQALNRISDAAADISTLSASTSAGIPEIFKSVIEHSDERISRISITESCLKDILQQNINDIEDLFGFDIMAISREDYIHFKINKMKLKPADVIYIRGPQNSIQVFSNTAKGFVKSQNDIRKELESTTSTPKEILQEFTELEKKILTTLIKQKHKSELSINLAFTALLLNDQKLANEVMRLEKEMDHLDRSLGLQALKLESVNIDQQEKVLNLIGLSKALEEIADASLWLIEPFILDTERHPLLKEVVQDSKEKVSVHEVEENSEAIGRTVEEFESRVQGMWIMAIYRPEKGYLFDPKLKYIINKGETLLIRAYGRQKKRLQLFEESST